MVKPSIPGGPVPMARMPGPELLEAASLGKAERLEEMLLQGADPNWRNDGGETALHLAASRGHTQTAACLLAYGANPAIPNNQGLTALSLSSISPETLHAIRQRYHRFRPRDLLSQTSWSEQALELAGALDRWGIIKLAGLLEADSLRRLQRDFQGFIRNLDDKLNRGEGAYGHYDEEEHWWLKDRAYVCNNAFKYSTHLVKVCCHETLLEVFHLYLGSPGFISRGVAMRYLPNQATDNDMFGWHHDMEERRLKVMILLTDVGENDQLMSYIRGSHQIYHPLAMFLQNPCGLEYCKRHLGQLDVFRTMGKAGDAFLFDSNGAHRGNRRPDAAVRDAFFIEYTTDKSDIWGGDVSHQVFQEIPLRGHNPFERLMATQPKWARPPSRNLPTWVTNLPNVETWL